MPDLPVPLDLLRLNNEGTNRAFAILLSSIMLFPDKKHEKNCLHYRSVNILNSVSFLVDKCGFSKKEAGSKLVELAESLFGNWESFVSSLLSKRMAESGHGSIQSLSERAYLAGAIFYNVFVERCGVDIAARNVYSGADSLNFLGERSYNEENLKNNIWPRWKNAAHLWAALLHFEMPDPSDGYIALDKIVLKSKNLGAADGIEGLIDVASYYYDVSIEQNIGSKKSSERLVNEGAAWNVFLV